MAKKKIPLESWDSMDDDLDFDLGDFGGFDKKDDRKATTKLASGIKSAALSKAGAGNLAKGLIFSSLPKSYAGAYSELTSVSNDVTNLYYTAKRESEPAFKAAKAVLRTFAPITNKILPKKLASKLAASIGEDDSYYENSSVSDSNDAEITNTLQGIFGAERAQSDSQHQEQIAHTTLDRSIGEKQFEYSAKAQGAQTDYLSRIVGYQDSILSAYHKKSLELQYRQYFATKELLLLSDASTKAQLQELQAIHKNTGLPDAIKMQNSEIFTNRAKNLLIGSSQDYMRGRLGGVTSKLKYGLVEELKNYVSSITNGLSQLENIQNMVEMPGMDITSAVGSGIGEEAMGGLGKLIGLKHGKKIKSLIGRYVPDVDAKVNTFGNKLDRLRYEWPSKLQDKMHDANGEGIYGFLHKVMGYSEGDRDVINKNLQQDATETVGWDVLSRRTLIDIIPGYLSRNLQKLSDVYNILSGSTKKSDRITYSTESENFITQKERNKEVTKKFKNNLTSGIKTEVDTIIDHINPNKTLTPAERIKLGLFLSKEASSGRSFRPQNYGDVTNLPGDIAAKVAPLFTKAYGIENDGFDVVQGIPKYKTTNSEEISKRHLDSSIAFGRLRDSFTGSANTLSTMYKVGDTESLRSVGALDNYGVNKDYLWSLVEQLLASKDYNEFYNNEPKEKIQSKPITKRPLT